MATVKSLRELEDAMYEKIDVALNTEVASYIKNEMLNNIKFYLDLYHPVEYDRRGNDGGLESPASIISRQEERGSIDILNIARVEGPRLGDHPYVDTYPDETGFAKMLAGEGKGVVNPWNMRDDYEWLQPRPFVNDTYNTMSDDLIFDMIKRQFE